jgi:hypothetical protein
MRLMHELEEFVDHRLEEFPMCFQKSRILANNIHDICRYHRFVVFAAFHFAQTQQILDNCNQEAFLGFLV